MAIIEYPIEPAKTLENLLHYARTALDQTWNSPEEIRTPVACAHSFARAICETYPLAEMWALIEQVAADRDNPLAYEAWSIVQRVRAAKTHDTSKFSPDVADELLVAARKMGATIRETVESI